MCVGNPHILATKCYFCSNYNRYNICHTIKVHFENVVALRSYTGADMEIYMRALKLANNNYEVAVDILRDCSYAVKVNCEDFLQ